jgi:hypothetical protein
VTQFLQFFFLAASGEEPEPTQMEFIMESIHQALIVSSFPSLETEHFLLELVGFAALLRGSTVLPEFG